MFKVNPVFSSRSCSCLITLNFSNFYLLLMFTEKKTVDYRVYFCSNSQMM